MILSLVGCSAQDSDISEPAFQTNDTTKNTQTDNTAQIPQTSITKEEPVTNPPISVGNDAAIKQELISKYGLPFRIWRTEGMALWYFRIDETTATRTYTHSLEDGMTEHASLWWEIINGELVISGAWNETFTINIEENTVTSQTDGAIYKLLKEQE